jgi:hypothetical protein
MKRSFKLKKVLGVIAIAALAITVLSALVMLLWNNVLAVAVPVKLISFGQAAGILLLSKILFGGFRGGGGWRGRGGHWSSAMREKWQAMTPEEREKFGQEWKGRCKVNTGSPA